MTRYAVLLLITGILAIGIPAHAQQSLDVIFYGGYTNSTFSGGNDKVLGEDSKNGFTAGAGIQLQLADYYGIEAGLRFARKGGGGVIDSTFVIPSVRRLTKPIGNADITLDYMEVPLSFVMLIDMNEASYFRAYLGPSINILLRARTTGEIDGEPIDEDIKSTMQTAHVTGFVGGSFVYKFTRLSVMLDARYSRGLTNVTDGPDVKTTGFELAAGIAIPLASYQ